MTQLMEEMQSLKRLLKSQEIFIVADSSDRTGRRQTRRRIP